MKRCAKRLNRIKFVQKAIKNNKLAAEELRLMSIGLGECRNFNQTLNALSDIFGVSTQTIIRDLETEL